MGDVLWRHIGHCPLADSCLIHWEMQCLWKLWPHLPDTAEGFSMLSGGGGSGGQADRVHSRLQETDTMDKSHQSGSDRSHRHRLLGCPSAMSPQPTTF